MDQNTKSVGEKRRARGETKKEKEKEKKSKRTSSCPFFSSSFRFWIN